MKDRGKSSLVISTVLTCFAFVRAISMCPVANAEEGVSQSASSLRIGAARADITPGEPIAIAGQMHRRLGNYAHDPLTVNAVAFGHDKASAVLVSCDLCFLPDVFVRKVQSACEERCGIPGSHVLLACTHTHLGPCTQVFLPEDEVTPAFMKHLHESLVRVVGEAMADMEEVAVFAGKGWLDHMGFNRRGLHKDGKADMYHGSWSDDFAGVEGPRDGEVPVIFARKRNGNMKVIITSFATHPNCNEGESYYSADVPGAVRSFLRHNLGEEVDVIYLTGAAGNTAPSQLENNRQNVQYWRGEEGLKRSGVYLGSEVLKVIAATTEPMVHPRFHLAQVTVKIPLRPWPDSFDPNHTFCPPYYEKSRASWPRMLREENPVDVRLNVLRIGSAAICANPAELYVEHGLAIKEFSSASVTVVSELTDGYVGYVPTQSAFQRGGYSTWTCPTSKLATNAGQIIVEQTRKLLQEAFHN